MPKLAIIARPLTKSSSAYLLLKNESNALEKYTFDRGQAIHIVVCDSTSKYCTGWYDVTTHTNYACSTSAAVDMKFDSCFECRRKTGFNPAFYNTANISPVQAQYNAAPHTVYVAYFGDGLAKAGIMSDSRGIERLYEQGALLYCIVGTFENATQAHNAESSLINAGLRNSVTKRQKEKALTKLFDVAQERQKFSDILKNLDLAEKQIISNLDHFFFGEYPREEIKPIGDNPISGTVRGVVGRYMVLANNDRLYGFWLSSLSGFEVDIDDEITDIAAEPQQISMFG